MATDSPLSGPDMSNSLSSAAAVNIQADGNVYSDYAKIGWLDPTAFILDAATGVGHLKPGYQFAIDRNGPAPALMVLDNNGQIVGRIEGRRIGPTPLINGLPTVYPGGGSYVVQGSGCHYAWISPTDMAGARRPLLWFNFGAGGYISDMTFGWDGVYMAGTRIAPDPATSNTSLGGTASFIPRVPIRFGLDGLYIYPPNDRVAPLNMDTNTQIGLNRAVQASNQGGMVGLNAINCPQWHGPDGGVLGWQMLADTNNQYPALASTIVAYGFTSDMKSTLMFCGHGNIYRCQISGGLLRFDWMGHVSNLSGALAFWWCPLVQGNPADQPQTGVYAPEQGAR